MRLVVILLFLAFPVIAHAGLDETKNELEKRYGLPYANLDDANLAGVSYLFFHESSTVAATMVDGVCQRVVYQVDYGKSFTNDQIQELLNDNRGDGHVWIEDHAKETKAGYWKAWERTDGAHAEFIYDYIFVFDSGKYDLAMASKKSESHKKLATQGSILDKLDKIPNPDPTNTGKGSEDGAPVLVLTARGAFINQGYDRGTLYLSSEPAIPFDQVVKALSALPNKAWPHGRRIWFWGFDEDKLVFPNTPDSSEVEKVVSDLKTAKISIEYFETEPSGWTSDGTH